MFCSDCESACRFVRTLRSFITKNLVAKMSGLKNGLLIITCLSKLTASLSLASKKIVNHLYIHYQPAEPLKFEKFSSVSHLNFLFFA